MRFLMKLAGAFVSLLLVLSVGSLCAAILLPPLPASSSPLSAISFGGLPMTPNWATLGTAVLAGFGLLLVGLVVGLIAAMKFFAGGQRTLRRDPDQLNETLMTQEIHAGLSRMEDRVEALETILFDRAAPSPHQARCEVERPV
ncbi:MAG: hypothetical protein R6V12_11345 [Candidatus Hydrogenedentota bacterium]